MEEKIIISLGGSLIVPEELDINFLRDFKKLILSQVEQGKKFIIITGGGTLNRKYNQAAKDLSNPEMEDLDWIGIASLRLNAELMRVIFEDKSHGKVINNLAEPFSFDRPIVIGAAYEPGKSTDWDAVLAAKYIGAKKIINLSNIDYVYDKDPRVNADAKQIENISWSEYRKIIPAEWTSRLSSPFDPIASKMAEEEGIEAVIMNGKPISNLENYLTGKQFQGTRIK
ncbi:UMP kinase [Candidatus Nomurabacteria bacterium]|nr:UMP kinase [Candidatus Nomurabacteria bacterium]